MQIFMCFLYCRQELVFYAAVVSPQPIQLGNL